MAKKVFQVVYDRDYECYIIREASNAFAQSMVPKNNQSEFNTKAQALDQVRRLHLWQDKGNEIETVNSFTPGCFETVADKKYGSAWN